MISGTLWAILAAIGLVLGAGLQGLAVLSLVPDRLPALLALLAPALATPLIDLLPQVAGLLASLAGTAASPAAFGAAPPLQAAALALHTAGAFAGAVGLLACAPRAMRQPAWQGLLFNASFLFFIPVGGFVLLGGAQILIRLLPFTAADLPTDTIMRPRFESRLLDRVRPGEDARARAQINNIHAGPRPRIAAMTAVRQANPHVTSDLLHQLLGDRQDEMRLLAYGILDQAEKRITSRIIRIRNQLDAQPHARRAVVHHAHLAELYWELIYQHLVQGEMHRYALEQSAHHARQALHLRPNLASMHFLLGRHALLQQAPEAAQEHLSQARKHGVPEAQLAPWLGEALFQEGRLDQVGYWMQRSAPSGAGEQLQSAVRYWA